MADISITDAEIAEVEKLLLPASCHFAEDAKAVIRHWNSVDVMACPGSGKTTVLLAKLKMLADRMPFEDGAGICVLSHTNVAVDEIKGKLSRYADKLMNYPNYIGTIHSFVDKYVTIPYLRGQSDVPLSFVNDAEYAARLYAVIWDKPYPNPYYQLFSYIRMKYESGSFPYTSAVGYFQNVSLRPDGIYHRDTKIAGTGSDSYRQYEDAKAELLKKYGVLRYSDTYSYVKEAVEALSDDYTSLFNRRFRYVFIDEYQDCEVVQRDALEKIFNPKNSCVFHIGDADQSIFGSVNSDADEWMPNENYLQILSTCRYGQCIADILTPLRRNKVAIVSRETCYSLPPTIIVFDNNSIGRVPWQFLKILDDHGLYDANGIYKAIGAIRSDDTKGLSIGNYWSEFDSKPKVAEDGSYWAMIEAVKRELTVGKLYRAEKNIRKLLTRLFHFAKIKDGDTDKEFNATSIRKALHNEYWASYSSQIVQLVAMPKYTISAIDLWLKNMICTLMETADAAEKIYVKLPEGFMEQSSIKPSSTGERNVFIDPIKGRRIVFDTIHGVKGETHDATLYLETEKSRGSDIGRILYHYGVGKANSSSLYEQSRKLAYVAMSRPRKLLCVAVQDKTYEKGKAAFSNWEIVDIRGNNK